MDDNENNSLDDIVSGGKKYLITGAQYEAPVNHKTLDSFMRYADDNEAEILILPVKYKKKDEERLAPRLQQFKVIDSDYRLNDSIQIAKHDVRPQSIEPITGLSRFAKTGKTTIFASPKQRLKVLPNHLDLPKVMMTTGFITKPVYDRDFVISSKARRDHKFGGVIVELANNKMFHYRHIESQVNGKFIDLATMYNGNRTPTKVRPYLAFGDIHAQDVNKKVHQENQNIISSYNPKGLMLHDLFDGKSINHWSKGKSLDKQLEYAATGLSLEKEAKTTYKILMDYASLMPKDAKVYIVKSNHDERIDRWLNEDRFVDEPQNAYIGHKLWIAKREGKDPLKTLFDMQGTIPDNVVFLDRAQSFNKWGVELGYHGDERMNGGRGSIRSKEEAYGKSVTAHTHSPEILRDTYVLGTCTDLQLDYNTGNSGWMNTSAMIYSNGKVQLYNYIKGQHRLSIE